jgi:transcriptional regulator with XRE-family HTH domain
LRREEVAQLAHVGVSWYTLLEQGRDIHPSKEVLHSIADALQLTLAERQHLFLLADQPPFVDTHAPDEHEEQVSPALHRVLDALTPVPAFIIGRRWNYLAWNITADYIFQLSRSVPPHDDNAVWRMFADPMREQIHYPTWEQVAQKVVAEFRADSVRYADEAWFKCLVADLQRVSPEFCEWWPHHDVRGRADARKDMAHPLVGRLMFEHTTLQVPTIPDLKIMIYTPLPDTDTLEKLQQLTDAKIQRV